MWIDAGCGLLPVGHVYSEADKHKGEESVPLPLGVLGLVTGCTLTDSFGGLKSGRKCGIRHAGRVSGMWLKTDIGWLIQGADSEELELFRRYKTADLQISATIMPACSPTRNFRPFREVCNPTTVKSM